MIFASLAYDEHYSEAHSTIDAVLRSNFTKVESGFQCDSWFWVYSEGHRVEVDTFRTEKHVVKSSTGGPHVERVLRVLADHFEIHRREIPEREPHEWEP